MRLNGLCNSAPPSEVPGRSDSQLLHLSKVIERDDLLGRSDFFARKLYLTRLP